MGFLNYLQQKLTDFPSLLTLYLEKALEYFIESVHHQFQFLNEFHFFLILFVPGWHSYVISKHISKQI